MQSTAFRFISTIVTLILLGALAFALLLVIRSNPNTTQPLALATTSPPTTPAIAAGVSTAATSTPTSAPTSAPTRTPTFRPTTNSTIPAATTAPTATLALVESIAATDTLPADALPAETQPIETRLFTDPNAANAATVVDETLWIATSGGALARDLAAGTTTRYTTLDGLRSHVVDSVVNCPLDGLGVVFGSAAGLQIFGDDARWRTISPANSSMTDSNVSTLECVPEANALVVGYAESGIDIFDAVNDTWSHLDRNNGLAGDSITSLEVAPNFSALWVATEAGLTVLGAGPTEARISILTGQNSPLQSNAVGDLEITEDGDVWIGGEGVLYQFRPPAADAGASGEWTVYTANAATIRSPLASPPVQPRGGFPGGFIRAILPGEDGTLWLGSTPLDPATGSVEICQFDPTAASCLVYANLGQTSDIDGAITQSLTGLAVAGDDVFYTNARGVAQLDGDGWSALSLVDDALAANTVRDVAETADGTIFVATASGVQPIRGSAVGSVLVNSRDVAVLQADASGGLWLGGNGVRYLPNPDDPDDVQIFEVADGLIAERVQALAVDAQGRTWIGTDVGLSIWNGDSFFNLDAASGLPNENITALLADEVGVWIGSTGGLFRFQENRLQIYDLAQTGLPNTTVTALAIDATDGALLIGTRSGAARLLGDDVEPLPVAQGERITTLATGFTTTGSGEIVLGATSGAWRFDGVEWSRLRPVDGLPSTSVSTALIAADGAVWIGGNSGGLARIVE